MRASIEIDDTLLAQAQDITGLTDISAVIHQALKALVEREAARRLARLGGTEPGLKPVPRRRPKKIK